MAKYDRHKLIAAIDQGESFEYLLFYGHKVSEDGSITDSCLSQWYPATFKIDDVSYKTAEQFMMAQKARLFGDEDMLNKILQCQTPKEAKAYGRKVQNFVDEKWKEHCSQIVVKANQAKFSQNPELAKYLLSTEPHVLVEASLWDRIWGIGMAKSNTKALDPKQWKGQNLLGFALMEVRDQLGKS
ncbi:MAG: NADAR family protein [Candidatus Obscuribacter sp.]|nr:NADAR family protein [Candidatus Obscuribacter sp.]MBK9774568.1 NADAR family protein [Candidatus Obscuribacter sp.]